MSATTNHVEEEDPYKILRVPPNATQQQIKSSYRKLALQYHPDKQSSEQDKRNATQIFAKISGAYEILSDETLRRDYDLAQQQQQSQSQHSHSHGFSGEEEDVFHHPFFTTRGFHFGGDGFMDPFELFNRVFADELGAMHRQSHRQHQQQQQHSHRSHHEYHHAQHQQSQRRRRRDPFDDPFFTSGFGTSFGGGGGGGGAFAMMDQMMSSSLSSHHSMMNMMNSSMRGMEANLHQQMMMDMGGAAGGGGGGRGQGGRNFSSSSSFSTSSSSSFGGGSQSRGGINGSISESVSTTTRIVNGRRQTITERIVTKADGSVERHVETTSGTGNEYGQIGNGGGGSERFLRY